MRKLGGKLACIDATIASLAVACVAAALAPLAAPSRALARFPGWPSQLDDRALDRLADTPEEMRFYAGRAVEHARFTDGRRILLLRWVDGDLRGFHLSRPCFLAYGYSVGPVIERKGPQARPERCFRATRVDETVEVCEHIRDADGHTFPSIESWRLARLLGRTRPPAWGVSWVSSVSGTHGPTDAAGSAGEHEGPEAALPNEWLPHTAP